MSVGLPKALPLIPGYCKGASKLTGLVFLTKSGFRLRGINDAAWNWVEQT
jgi:hypothetical protein